VQMDKVELLRPLAVLDLQCQKSKDTRIKIHKMDPCQRAQVLLRVCVREGVYVCVREKDAEIERDRAREREIEIERARERALA